MDENALICGPARTPHRAVRGIQATEAGSAAEAPKMMSSGWLHKATEANFQIVRQ